MIVETIEVQLKGDIEDSYELSHMQQGMLFNSLYIQNSGVDIEQIVCSVHEKLNISAFEQAWLRIIQRHPVLRTSFSWQGDNQPLQHVHQQVSLPLKYKDWRGLCSAEQENRLDKYLQLDRQRGFQLDIAPLVRLALFQLDESNYRFIWTFHHALLDGRSLLIVFKEFLAFYNAFSKNKNWQLATPPAYREHIKWLQQQDLSKAESFWRQWLKDFTAPTPLIVDQPTRAIKDQGKSGFGEQKIRLSLECTSKLQSLAEQHQLTLNTILQGAWALLLSRYSAETDIVFGATRACRHSSVAGAESMVGMLINTLPVRLSVPSQMPLLHWLKKVREAWMALRDYEHTPLVKIQEWSDLPGGQPLFDSIVVFENYILDSTLRRTLSESQASQEGFLSAYVPPFDEPKENSNANGGMTGLDRKENLEVQPLEQTNYPLTLLGYKDPKILIRLIYDRQRFDEATITRMLGHIQTLLESMANNPWQPLAEVQILTPEERHQMLVEWNNTQTDYPHSVCIHQLFEAQVELAPDAVAVVFDNKQLTYYELNCRANQIAHHLKQLGVGPGVLVAVYLERSLEMIPALLGILKAGGAYVPIETSWPPARVQLLLSSLKINFAIVQSSQLLLLRELQQLPKLEHLICLDSQQNESTVGQLIEAPRLWQIWTPSHLEQLPIENLPERSSSDDIAYIIFTSGSTGTPKGVVVRHKPVLNLIDWVNKKFNVNSSDRVLFITSLCFDLSVYDVFGLLAAGGSIRVVSSHDVRDPMALLRILFTEPITFWDSAPAALQQLVPFFPHRQSIYNNSQLRLVFLSGDWIPVKLPDFLKTNFPKAEVISLGGATEATIWSNYYPIKDVEPHWVSIPYGKPIQNAQYYILDSYLNPCPIGVPGQLYIGGECLSSGYFNQPILNAEKFISNPFSSTEERLYKTGDLARHQADGNIEFLGRIDHQVKVRGFRIELGEIETVLAKHPAVQDVAILAQEDGSGNKSLVAYLVVKNHEPALNELRHFLLEQLPDYMLPSSFFFLDAMPLTPNGKIDRHALPAVDMERSFVQDTFVAPHDLLELQLVQIWEQVLGIQPIGALDNFFELGGHSLLAVQMFAQIEKIFNKNIPIATLFQAPTVEQLVKILRQQGLSDPWQMLVAIQPYGSKPPLFCVHEIGGNVFFYHSLARHLGTDQPFYGLQPRGLDGKEAPHTQIEEMAADYIKEIRKLQPEGPYFLGGYSFGGTVAFEMAQQLQKQGQKVALLAFFDCPPPGGMKSLSLGERMFVHAGNFLREGATYALHKASRRIKSSKKGLHSFISRLHSKLNQKSRSNLSDVYFKKLTPRDNFNELRRQAAANYVPKPYSGKMTLFQAINRENFEVFYSDPLIAWKALATGALEVHHIPGNHLTIFKEPNLEAMATVLKASLQQAQEEADNSGCLSKLS